MCLAAWGDSSLEVKSDLTSPGQDLWVCVSNNLESDKWNLSKSIILLYWWQTVIFILLPHWSLKIRCFTIRYMMMLWYNFSSNANWFDKVIFSIFFENPWLIFFLPTTVVFVFKVYWVVIHLLQFRLPDGPQLKKSQRYTIVIYNTIQYNYFYRVSINSESNNDYFQTNL